MLFRRLFCSCKLRGKLPQLKINGNPEICVCGLSVIGCRYEFGQLGNYPYGFGVEGFMHASYYLDFCNIAICIDNKLNVYFTLNFAFYSFLGISNFFVDEVIDFDLETLSFFVL